LDAKWDKLNPVRGFQGLFSGKNLVRGLMDLGKFGAVVVVIYSALKSIVKHEIFGATVGLEAIGEFLFEAFSKLLAKLILVMGVIAGVNYLYQRYRVGRDLMMTKDEVKDERKSQEGSPRVKSAVRAMARRLLRKQMLKAIPLADVVVTNPTHYAVAIKYESGKDLAPIVLAKGENMFAKKIKGIAEAHGVPMVENKPVAQLLYKVGKVGEPVPPNLSQVVAEILAAVYKTHRYYFHRLQARRLAEEK
jgi:flagellar biosynthetic protein FlhB